MLQKLRISEYINRLIAANGKIKLADAVARNYFQHNPSFLYTMYISDIIDILNSRCGRTYPEQLCVCLRIVVSNTYSVVFLFCLSLSMLQFFWIVQFWLSLWYSPTFICWHTGRMQQWSYSNGCWNVACDRYEGTSIFN